MREYDAAVGAGMAELNFRRNDPRTVDLEVLDTGVACKRSNCDLRIDPRWLYDILVTHNCPGALWQTWVHEAIHARAPFFVDWKLELAPYQGYEDGFAEMLAQNFTMVQARLPILSGSYDYYVEAYKMLVRASGADEQTLWRALYKCPPGTIRNQLPTSLERSSGRSFSNEQKDEILALADSMFASTNWNRKTSLLTASESYIRWKRVLR